MLEITFAVQAWEFFEGLLLSTLKRLFPRAAFLVFPIIMLVGLLGVLGVSDDPLTLLMYAGILFVVILLLLAGVPALRAYQSGRDPQRSASVTWKIGEHRMEIQTSRGKAKVGWKTFERPMETWHLFLLHSAADKRSIYILPKRAFRDDAQRERFREIVKKVYGKLV